MGVWWVCDREDGRIIAAASVDVTLWAFDLERKPTSDRRLAVPKGALPGLSEQVA